MQDMEFTIEDKKLYMLQTRNGKRTAAAAIKIACDLIDEGMISEEEALMQIDAKSLDMLLHPGQERCCRPIAILCALFSILEMRGWKARVS